MIGTLRFLLSMLVVFNHLWLPTANKVGAHAVAAFYIVSGLLMAKVIQEAYKARPAQYLANRAMRLLPLYWCVALISAALLAVFPTTFGQTYSSMQLPQTAWSWWQNIFLIDLASSPQALAPPAWSLSVEAFFYVAMLGLARSKRIALTWLIVSLAYTVYLVASGAPFSDRYTPVTAASICFATGACIYFYGQSWRVPVWVALVALPVFMAFPLLTTVIGADPHMLGYYGATLLFIPILIALFWHRDARMKPIDDALGHLAYPVFLCHFMAAGMVRIALPWLQPYGTAWFALSVGLTLGIGIVWVRFEQRWIAPLRDSVRSAPEPSADRNPVRPLGSVPPGLPEPRPQRS